MKWSGSGGGEGTGGIGGLVDGMGLVGRIGGWRVEDGAV